MTDQPLIFPRWTICFRENPRIAPRLERIAEIRSKRAQGNQELPHVRLNDLFWRCYELYPRLRIANTSLAGRELYDTHFACVALFTLVALRTFWARWLYLERAFESASRTGDLLFGAIVLRTMAEDVWALHELNCLGNQINPNVATHTADDFARLCRLGDLLWSRFLPPSREFPSQIPLQPFDGQEYEQLKRTFQSLNDYVHPNYGSHLLALFPERARALEVLLDAYIEVYNAFFRLPWAESGVEKPSTALPPIVTRPLSEEIDRFLNSLLPEIQKHRADRGLAAADDDPAPHLRRSLMNIRQEDYELLWQVVPDWFEPLRPLAYCIVGRTASDRELCESMQRLDDIGIATLPYSLLGLAGARRLAAEFEQLFPSGRPDPQQDFPQWLRFFVKGIEFILTITTYKMDAMQWAIIRQLNDRNPVGSILAMRSLIEHYAVTVYIGERLTKSWHKVAQKGSRGGLDREELLKLEEHIARFLAGTKGTIEDATWWKQEWEGLGLDKAMNLRGATEQGLRQDVLGYLYNFGSDVIHGRKARGIELCPPTDTAYIKANLSRSVMALDLLASPNYIIGLLGQSHNMLQQMKTLHQALVQPDGEPSRIISRAFSSMTGELRRGVHYSGSGTFQDPFLFSPGVEYITAFYKLCGQLGLDMGKRKLIRSTEGRFLDAVPDKHGNLYYFAAPVPPIEGDCPC